MILEMILESAIFFLKFIKIVLCVSGFCKTVYKIFCFWQGI